MTERLTPRVELHYRLLELVGEFLPFLSVSVNAASGTSSSKVSKRKICFAPILRPSMTIWWPLAWSLYTVGKQKEDILVILYPNTRDALATLTIKAY